MRQFHAGQCIENPNIEKVFFRNIFSEISQNPIFSCEDEHNNAAENSQNTSEATFHLFYPKARTSSPAGKK